MILHVTISKPLGHQEVTPLNLEGGWVVLDLSGKKHEFVKTEKAGFDAVLSQLRSF